MPEITFRHEFECDEDTFWTEFFRAEYNQKLYLEALGFPGYQLLDSSDGPDRRTKKVRIDPPVTGLPGPLKKVIGDRLSYVEEGSLDKKTGRYSFHVIPSTKPDKTKTEGELWCEKLGDKRIARHARIFVEVKVFAVGGLIEDKIVSDLRRSYEESAKFMAQWLKAKGP
ncbi:MAG: DUF2505 family protein [Myxococcales bacterium]|nr:DUF2505 family protein [Myxococcales bacterium]